MRYLDRDLPEEVWVRGLAFVGSCGEIERRYSEAMDFFEVALRRAESDR
jgi:hypothetical protein